MNQIGLNTMELVGKKQKSSGVWCTFLFKHLIFTSLYFLMVIAQIVQNYSLWEISHETKWMLKCVTLTVKEVGECWLTEAKGGER